MYGIYYWRYHTFMKCDWDGISWNCSQIIFLCFSFRGSRKYQAISQRKDVIRHIHLPTTPINQENYYRDKVCIKFMEEDLCQREMKTGENRREIMPGTRNLDSYLHLVKSWQKSTITALVKQHCKYLSLYAEISVVLPLIKETSVCKRCVPL